MKSLVSPMRLCIAILLLAATLSSYGSAIGGPEASLLISHAQLDILGPGGSGGFGSSVTALPGGNIVVTDPGFDSDSTEDVGAVYLYSGEDGALIGVMTGSHAGDQVGSGGVTLLEGGDFVVSSPLWDNTGAPNAGAVTWVDGTSGLSGQVSVANSLVGTSQNDQVGKGGVTPLKNGNFVVVSDSWDNGSLKDAGAVTWGNGASGIQGPVTVLNSLVGGKADDSVGFNGVTALVNGNYVVNTYTWDNGSIVNAGSATWADGTRGITGTVSAQNSLVGGGDSDWVGLGGSTALENGNYVVKSPYWGGSRGAATWGDGTHGITGTVSADNSLVGGASGDYVSIGNVTALSNSNYVVCSSNWDNVGAPDAGAATWGDGASGITGTLTVANSLVGSMAQNYVCSQGVTQLANGNYVVGSHFWDSGFLDVGAATWGDGSTGITGTVSADNSLVGTSAQDEVGKEITPLSNGNYVVASPEWDNDLENVGAATWGDGDSGISGPVSTSNSLVGSAANDKVSSAGVTALTNGNYVVSSGAWKNGSLVRAGAVTWGAGSTGITGTISAINSLVGSRDEEAIGNYGTTALSDGNYVVISSNWGDGAIHWQGAATWGDGISGAKGSVSSHNSLVGGASGDNTGTGGVTPLTGGRYVVFTPNWDNGPVVDAGAISVSKLSAGLFGQIDSQNSVLGLIDAGGASMVYDYDAVHNQLVVGRPAENIVTLFSMDSWIYLPLVRR